MAVKPQGSLNGVSDEQLREAIEYLYSQGFIDEMTTDKNYYVSILLGSAADKLGILLEDLNLD